jgi:hypothetical protein
MILVRKHHAAYGIRDDFGQDLTASPYKEISYWAHLRLPTSSLA